MSKRHKQEKTKQQFIIFILLGLLITSTGVFLFFTEQSSGIIVWDEAAYLSNARSHLTQSYYTEDYRFPLLEYIISGTWLITGESIVVAQILMILITLASIFMLYFLAKEFLHDDWLALLTSTLYALSQPILFWGFRVYNDILSITLTMLVFYLYIKKNNKIHDYTIGALFSLVFLTRFPAILFALVLGVDLLVKKEINTLKRILLGGGAVLLVWLIGNTITYGNPLFDLFGEGAIILQHAPWQSAWLFFSNIYAVFGLSLLLLIPFIIALCTTQRKNNKWILLTGILLLTAIFYAGINRMKLLRYSIMMLPFLLIAIVLGAQYLFTWFFKKYPQRKHLQYIIIIFSVLFLLGNALYISFGTVQELQWIKHCQDNGAVQQSIVYLQEHYPPGTKVTSNFWTIYGYYNNYDVGSIWDKNMSEIFKGDTPEIIVYVLKKGAAFPQEILTHNKRLFLEATFNDSCKEKISIYKVLKNDSTKVDLNPTIT